MLGLKEKSKEEDDLLKERAVTFTKFDDLADFEADHPFTQDSESFVNSVF